MTTQTAVSSVAPFETVKLQRSISGKCFRIAALRVPFHYSTANLYLERKYVLLRKLGVLNSNMQLKGSYHIKILRYSLAKVKRKKGLR
jgi:hypothetical protein